MTAAERLAKLKQFMPTDPRGWWTGEEADGFIDAWRAPKLPELTMCDGQSDVYLFWCEDPGRAAEMLGLLSHAEVDDGSFTIKHGEYSACIAQADSE